MYQCPVPTSPSTTTDLATTTSSSTAHILVLWEHWEGTTINAIVTTDSGETRDIRFGTEGDVTLRSYCSLTFENQFYILGLVFRT